MAHGFLMHLIERIVEKPHACAYLPTERASLDVRVMLDVSGAEMEALRSLPQVRIELLAKGKLAVHEEFPDAVADAIERFLRETEPSTPQAQDREPDQPERLGA